MRILLVKFPLQTVPLDVFADSVELLIVSNDVLIVVALPDRETWCITNYVDVFGGGGFQGAHDRGNRTWDQSAE